MDFMKAKSGTDEIHIMSIKASARLRENDLCHNFEASGITQIGGNLILNGILGCPYGN